MIHLLIDIPGFREVFKVLLVLAPCAVVILYRVDLLLPNEISLFDEANDWLAINTVGHPSAVIDCPACLLLPSGLKIIDHEASSSFHYFSWLLMEGVRWINKSMRHVECSFAVAIIHCITWQGISIRTGFYRLLTPFQIWVTVWLE